ncbi:MAG TPA: hypothetical protein VF975_04070 [Thermoanaerobaculia bacterium]
MKKFVTTLYCAFALLVAMCQQKSPAPARHRTGTVERIVPSDVRNSKVNEVIAPAPRFIDHTALGWQLGPEGTVTTDDIVIPAGKPVYLTLYLRESPPGLQTSAVWMDDDRKTLRTERRVMNGAKVATFTFSDRKLKPGHYKVVSYWGGNFATEREFQMLGSEQGKGKKAK